MLIFAIVIAVLAPCVFLVRAGLREAKMEPSRESRRERRKTATEICVRNVGAYLLFLMIVGAVVLAAVSESSAAAGLDM